jgi:riboflavin kinase/FMN adenylyltransferase
LTIGTFDGVHVGHQAVINTTVKKAADMGLTSTVMTFDSHPRSAIGKGGAPPLLTCTAHKLALIDKLGVDACVLVELDKNLASISAKDFVVEILHKKLRIGGIVVGPRLRFGRGRRGTPALLKRLGDKLGFWVELVDEVFVCGVPVSSTVVRQSIFEGNFPLAESLLGRRFSIMGRVVRGRTLGRELGYRTANISPLDQVVPPRGVYAVKVIVSGEEHPGALNVGLRPTFGSHEVSPFVLEVHILDFDRPIYRKRVELVFHRRIRDERRFDSPKQLATQIALDIEEVKRYFRSKRGGCSLQRSAATSEILAAGDTKG